MMVSRAPLLFSMCLGILLLSSTSYAWSVVPQKQHRSTTALHAEKGANKLAIVNTERVRAAGRKGTKKFVDPNKLFLGNLPFDATDADIWQFFKDNLGQTTNVRSIKIIRDWKTGISKGYGFCIMANPIYATTAMEFCKGKKIKNRIIRIDQGQKKPDDNQVYMKKNRKKAQTEEDKAIEAGLEEATDNTEDGYAADEDEYAEDDYDRAELAEIMEIVEDESNDKILFSDEDDDGFEFDGVFEEEYPEEYEALTEEEQQMNREQRREAQKGKKKKPLPNKGFG